MNNVYEHIIADINEWPITKHSLDRKEFMDDLSNIVFEKLKQSKHPSESLISKAIYMEEHRIKTSPWKVDPPDESNYWKGISSDLKAAQKSTDAEEFSDEILKRIINRYTAEITGNFKPKSFSFARKFLTWFFKVIFNKYSEGKWYQLWGAKSDLQNKIKLDGHIEEVRNLFSKGTIVIVPSHFSNLDSIMVGYSIDAVAGMPAFTYGAGLNLFDYEIPAYFMNRLGAYKVDRRKKNPIYLETLKQYVSYSLQKKVNNIFFPGGTRSRSGELENKLKLGLLGSIIEAQRENIIHERDEKIIIVPLIIGYHFVFEAKSLIEQHLKLTGKEKYRRTKSSTKANNTIWNFVKLLFKKDSEVYLSFGQPMDVFGNNINPNGESIDQQGNLVDFKGYFEGLGGFNVDGQREQVYTNLLGEKIVERFWSNNVILTSHLLAFTAFQYLNKQHKENDIYQVLNVDSKKFSIPYQDFKLVIQSEIDILKKWETQGKVKLSPEFDENIDFIIQHGLKYLGSYHSSLVLYFDEQENALKTQDIKLLYFYHNRMYGYSLENFVDWNINQ
jgi:glycerol-3-phosphate O-acyltransferase